MLAEPDIAPGDCRIEWADGGINRDRAATEAAIDEAVARYVAARTRRRRTERFLEIDAMSDDEARCRCPTSKTAADAGRDGRRRAGAEPTTSSTTRGAADLEAVFDVPVQVSAVLGRARMEVGDLLKLGPGAVLELDRKVGEAIDIYVNNRLVARGEVVLVEDKLGVTMTEIIKAERN